jgi:hypothetical protein
MNVNLPYGEGFRWNAASRSRGSWLSIGFFPFIVCPVSRAVIYVKIVRSGYVKPGRACIALLMGSVMQQLVSGHDALGIEQFRAPWREGFQGDR